ncbi:MAG: hypothetical protein ACO204_08050, partial [Schleiferiaceae bacterium]
DSKGPESMSTFNPTVENAAQRWQAASLMHTLTWRLRAIRRAMERAEEAMRQRAKMYKYQAPYLVDEGHKLADAFGARTTPHVFLFDATQTLVYLGAIDDNVDSAKKVKKTWLKDALTAVAAKQPVKVAQTKNLGCSIKRIQ